MDFSSRHINRLSQGISVPIPADEDGLVGRECPNANCEKYFKIKFGTGLKGEDLPCHCPYCGHIAEQDQFHTRDQIEYLKSVMTKEIAKALKADVAEWDRELRRSTRNSLIKLSMSYQDGYHPVHSYNEKELETHIVCDKCTLEYAIYGWFAYCPDCGEHNSFQILKTNLELVEKFIALARKADDPEFSNALVVKALETAVSTFDGFGRAFSEAYASRAKNPEKAKKISFQSLEKARAIFLEQFGKNFADGLSTEEWEFAIRAFQKRHLFAHKFGVYDEAYINQTNDKGAVIGRKVIVTTDEICSLVPLLTKIGANFSIC